jgi:hypothetical protein
MIQTKTILIKKIQLNFTIKKDLIGIYRILLPTAAKCSFISVAYELSPK